MPSRDALGKSRVPVGLVTLRLGGRIDQAASQLLVTAYYRSLVFPSVAVLLLCLHVTSVCVS